MTAPGTILAYAALGGLAALLAGPVVLRFQRSRRAGQALATSVLDHPLAAAFTAVVGGSVVAAVCAWRMPPAVQTVSAYLCVMLVLTSVVDIRVGRLPNLLVLPSFGVVAVLLALASRVDPDSGSLLRALAQTSAVLVFFTVAALALPRSLGMGDARLLALTATVLSYLSATGMMVMMGVLGALAAIVIGRRFYRGAPRSVICLGPLVAVATVGVLWFAPIPAGRPAVAETVPLGKTLVAVSHPVPLTERGGDGRGRR